MSISHIFDLTVIFSRIEEFGLEFVAKYVCKKFVNEENMGNQGSVHQSFKFVNLSEGDEDQKIIFLGPYEAGKSTIWRQFLIDRVGLSKENCISFVPAIKIDILKNMNLFLDSLKKSGIEFPKNSNISEKILHFLSISGDLNEALFDSDLIDEIWHDPLVQSNYERVMNEYTIISEHSPYFLNRIKIIAEDTYVPTIEDIQKAYCKNLCHQSLSFLLNNKIKILLNDVGGGSIERLKWHEYLHNVSYIIYVVSLCDFDELSLENGECKTLESFEIFKELFEIRDVRNSTIIFVLNKIDRFKTLMQNQSKQQLFLDVYSDYKGKCSEHHIHDCINHIKKTYLSIAKPHYDKEITIVEVCSFDSTSVNNLMQIVAKAISKDNE